MQLESSPGRNLRQFFIEVVTESLELQLEPKPQALWRTYCNRAKLSTKAGYWRTQKFRDDVDRLLEIVNTALPDGFYLGTDEATHSVWGFWEDTEAPA